MRDGSGSYSLPPGIKGVPDTTIESGKYNAFAEDIEQDLNVPRPIVAGGTGAGTAHDALIELGGEEAFQTVTNYDIFPFVPGSFYSAVSATASPVAGHGFVGICYAADALNMVLEARDETTADLPGKVYVREKKAGVWSAWVAQDAGMDATKVDVAGDTMTGPLKLSGDPTDPLHASTKAYTDAGDDARVAVAGDTMTGPLVMGPNAPIGLNDVGAPIIFGTSGHKFERHADGRLLVGGGAAEVEVVTSLLKLAGPPTADLHAATKKYADDVIGLGAAGKVDVAGDTMTGLLISAPSLGDITKAGSSDALQVVGGPTTDDAFMSFVRPGIFGVNFGLADDNKLKVGGWTMGSVLLEFGYNNLEGQSISGGAGVVVKALGNLLGATITVDPSKRPIQSAVNNGSGVISPANVSGQCTLYVTNVSGAAVPNTASWTLDGAFDAVAGSRFVCSCLLIPGEINFMSITRVP